MEDDETPDFSDLSDEGISQAFPAMAALADSGAVPPDMSSGDDISEEGIGGDDSDVPGVSRSPGTSRSRSIARLRAVNDNKDNGTPRDASSRPPSIDEWANFFGKVVLKTACNWYLSYAFKGIDEETLTDREVERLILTDDERKLITTPFAELAHKSKFMRKHGRSIVAGGDSINALVVMGAWISRVNRIAAKYRPRPANVRINGMSQNGSSGQGSSQGNGDFTAGATGGQVPNGYRIFNPGGS